jgi:hypothetical protein
VPDSLEASHQPLTADGYVPLRRRAHNTLSNDFVDRAFCGGTLMDKIQRA